MTHIAVMSRLLLVLTLLLVPGATQAQKPPPLGATPAFAPPSIATDRKPDALPPLQPGARPTPAAQTAPIPSVPAAPPPASRLPPPGPAAQPAAPPPSPAAFNAYRAALSAAALPAGSNQAAVTGWTLHYRGAIPNAAFVIVAAPDGRINRWRFISGRESPEIARRDAMSLCEAQDLANAPPGSACRMLAVNLALEGQRPVMAPRTETIGPFRASPMHWRHAPPQAAGVVLWSHGYGGATSDNRNSNAPGFLSVLNDAGFDIYRFDRSPQEDDVAASLARLLREAPLLRAAGYRRVVMAGQSRGAWQSILLAGAMPEAVDAVIAAAPAAHGSDVSGHTMAVDDFRRALAGLTPGRPRLAVALFDGDPFDPDVAARSGLVEAMVNRRTAPTLLLRPPTIRGHGGATELGFTQTYGACLLTFLIAPEAAAPRGVRRNICGGG